jgi:ubiquitin-activating enzyme E1 C
LDAFPPQRNFPLCTIAETPRRPEHCIAYAYILQWPKVFPHQKLDKDSPDDMKWIYDRAVERANQYNIPGVTYMLTMGVVKNIIPAVASTNAIISAVCVSEVVKLVSYMSQTLNTYMMYMGSMGVYSHTFIYERKDDCPVCTATIRKMIVTRTTTLNELLQQLRGGDLRLTSPSVTTSAQTLYMAKPPALEQATRPNLDKTLYSLLHGDDNTGIDEGGDEGGGRGQPIITVTDPLLQNINLGLSITFA